MYRRDASAAFPHLLLNMSSRPEVRRVSLDGGRLAILADAASRRAPPVDEDSSLHELEIERGRVGRGFWL